MSRFYITGGRQREDARGDIEWFSYAEALVLEADTETREVRPVVRYTTPPGYRPEEERANIVFKAGTVHDGMLHVCTQTEILAYDTDDFELASRTDHRWFNDLHHVTVGRSGHYLVALTGLDLAVEITREGEIVREWPALDEDPWQRFDRETDYRRVLTTKPHHAHPNFVFEADGEIWVTRLNQQDALCLTDARRTIAPMPEKVHDGVVFGNSVGFTTVDGRVAVIDRATGEASAIHDLTAMCPADRTLGWCRGLHMESAGRAVVGFSRIRPSKFKENVGWIKHRMGLSRKAGSRETRIAGFDLDAGRLEWEIDLEPYGLNAVFSILPAD